MIYSKVCMLSWFGSIAAFIVGLIKREDNQYLWLIGLVYFFTFPILYESLLNLKALIYRDSLNNHKCTELQSHFPIVYSASYNIKACGLEKCHPFDSCKYGRIFEYLKKKKIVDQSTKIHEPSIPSRQFLLEKMKALYLFRLNYSIPICACLEVPLFFLPAWFLRMNVLNPMMRATQGSVDAACIALQKGWAINLAGGYHHACTSKGGGFCIYPDITFIVHFMRKWHGISRILIIDLDAHQGNGHERDAIGDNDVHIVDAYNPYIYPGDTFAEQAIKTRIAVTEHDDDESYLQKLRNHLPQVYESFKPEFVIYNAGTDCMIHDPLGNLQISPQGIIARDELLFEYSLAQYQVPIVMLMSGGYQMTNAPVIADSIENIINKFKLKW